MYEFLHSQGQNETSSLRANVFRSCPNSRHRRAVPALPGCARTGRSLSYSITRSARASRASGITMPCVLAVCIFAKKGNELAPFQVTESHPLPLASESVTIYRLARISQGPAVVSGRFLVSVTRIGMRN